DYDLHFYITKFYETEHIATLFYQRNDQILETQINFQQISQMMTEQQLSLFEYPIKIVASRRPLEALNVAFNESIEIVHMSITGLRYLITKPKKNIQDQIGGPIKIGAIIGSTTVEAMKEGWQEALKSFFQLISYISLALAIFNLLPFPAVDGGHLILYSYEIITRRTINMRIIYTINFLGFMILIGLAIFIAFLDIGSLIK
ncbi:MAG: site-2 protease family protein, partial [Spirochaetes bacterium]|nr:site-2 protease family protein [Spirochaetota bacterium]